MEIRDFRLVKIKLESDSDQLEKRDHNNSVDNGYGVRKSDNCIKTQVVLEPDFETLNYDISSIIHETECKLNWSDATKSQLEAYIFELNSEPVCLDTDPALYHAIKNLPIAKNF